MTFTMFQYKRVPLMAVVIGAGCAVVVGSLFSVEVSFLLELVVALSLIVMILLYALNHGTAIRQDDDGVFLSDMNGPRSQNPLRRMLGFLLPLCVLALVSFGTIVLGESTFWGCLLIISAFLLALVYERLQRSRRFSHTIPIGEIEEVGYRNVGRRSIPFLKTAKTLIVLSPRLREIEKLIDMIHHEKMKQAKEAKGAKGADS